MIPRSLQLSRKHGNRRSSLGGVSCGTIRRSKPVLAPRVPASKSTQMITFSFENGAVITLRTSGTEPKVKYYAEMCASPQETYVFICDFQPVNLDKKWIDTM